MESPIVMCALCALIIAGSATGIAGDTSLVPAREEVVIPKTCTMDRVYKMVGYDCSSMNLKEVPQDLRSNLQIFDLSMNRIRKLYRKTFERYSDITLLYLFENMIHWIEEGTFSQLSDLQALDLSTNMMKTIPSELFSMSRLRNLYFADNTLDDLDASLMVLQKPIDAPLQQLNIAKCGLKNVPDVGILPSLVVLNISHNDLSEASPIRFSPYCALKIIDVNGTSMEPCMCQAVTMYMQRRVGLTIKNGITCEPPSDSGRGIYCDERILMLKDSNDYAVCLQNVRDIKLSAESRRTWLSVVGGLLTFFIVFMATLFICHRRNVRATEKYLSRAKLQQVHTTENGKIEILLNDLSTTTT